MHQARKLIEALHALDAGEIQILVGGIIPAKDVDLLKQQGIRGVFGPGTTIDQIESFIKAFQKIHQFKGEVTFGAWLKRIVINKSIDFLKSKKERFEELNENSIYIVEDDDWSVEDGISIDENMV